MGGYPLRGAAGPALGWRRRSAPQPLADRRRGGTWPPGRTGPRRPPSGHRPSLPLRGPAPPPSMCRVRRAAPPRLPCRGPRTRRAVRTALTVWAPEPVRPDERTPRQPGGPRVLGPAPWPAGPPRPRLLGRRRTRQGRRGHDPPLPAGPTRGPGRVRGRRQEPTGRNRRLRRSAGCRSSSPRPVESLQRRGSGLVTWLDEGRCDLPGRKPRGRQALGRWCAGGSPADQSGISPCGACRSGARSAPPGRQCRRSASCR